MSTQLSAMALSIAVEAPVALLLVLLFRVTAEARAQVFLAAALGTALTHPIVWNGALALYPYAAFWAVAALVESFAVLGEAPFYRFMAGLSWTKALGVSLGANAASTAVGFLVL